jgi:hypothetical protein
MTERPTRDAAPHFFDKAMVRIQSGPPIISVKNQPAASRAKA